MKKGGIVMGLPLASIQAIHEITPITHTDRIRRATVLDRTVVINTAQGLRDGDAVVLFTPGALLPRDDPRYTWFQRFGQHHTTIGHRDAYGHVLLARRIHGVQTNGLVLSLDTVGVSPLLPVGEDVTCACNAVSYRPDEDETPIDYPSDPDTTGRLCDLAVRYALGRASYAPRLVCSIVTMNAPVVHPTTRARIIRRIDTAQHDHRLGPVDCVRAFLALRDALQCSPYAPTDSFMFHCVNYASAFLTFARRGDKKSADTDGMWARLRDAPLGTVMRRQQ